MILSGLINYLKYNLSGKYRLKVHTLFDKRLEICKTCQFAINNKCSICECFLEIKTKVIYQLDKEDKSINGCPMKKW